MAGRRGRREAVVVGCGVVGMTTALALRADGCDVEVWTRDDPLATTSAAAGAIWYPYLAEPRERVLAWASRGYRRLAELARRGGSGVQMRDVVEVFDTAPADPWWRSAVPQVEWLDRDRVPAPHAGGIRVRVPVCDVPVHLRFLLGELERHGVTVLTRDVRDLDEALDRAPAVANCTGLGARELCDDRELYAVRGQVVVVPVDAATADPDDDAWIDDTGERPRYRIPHATCIVLGGSAQRGDERLCPDPRDTEAILAGTAWERDAIARSAQVRVGLRPCRTTVRVEREPRGPGRCLVHNYGHGGSGFTLAWGCADEVASLARGAPR